MSELELRVVKAGDGDLYDDAGKMGELDHHYIYLCPPDTDEDEMDNKFLIGEIRQDLGHMFGYDWWVILKNDKILKDTAPNRYGAVCFRIRDEYETGFGQDKDTRVRYHKTVPAAVRKLRRVFKGYSVREMKEESRY